MINWKGSKLEYKFAAKIAERAVRELRGDYPQIEMDIMACHLNGCPLDLEALATATPLDFAHDVLGIRRYIDRSTGQLTDCFSPRHAERQPIAP